MPSKSKRKRISCRPAQTPSGGWLTKIPVISTPTVSICFLLALHELFCLPRALIRVYVNL